MQKNKILDIKYALIQVLYLGAFCGLMGYASVYLLDKGFNNATIGFTLAAVSVISVFSQPAVASFADKHKNISLQKIIEVLVAVAVILSISMYFMKGATILLLCIFVTIATCLTTVQPLFNSLAFIFEKYGIEINFGLARGLGSAAYAFVSFLLGFLVEDFSASIIPIVYIILNILLIVVVHVFVVPKSAKLQDTAETQTGEETKQLSFFGFCKKYQRFMLFILGNVVVFLTHTIINNFFIQVITPIGGTESQMGTAIFLAAIVELPAMAMFNKIREKINCARLLQISAIIYALKHILTAFAPNMTVIYIAQLMQIGSYAIFLPAGVYYATQVVDQDDLIKGQSLLTMGFTASGIIANLIGGILLDAIGVHSVLMVGGVVSVIGALIVYFSVDRSVA